MNIRQAQRGGSVVTEMQPELHDLAHDLGREAPPVRGEELGHGGEVILRVLLEAAGVSDSYDVRVRLVDGDLSARAE